MNLKTTYKSQYLETLRKRAEAWKLSGNLGFKLRPESSGFDWIDALEHGTRQSSGPYIIVPRTGRGSLVFLSGGVLHFEKEIRHPGIRPHRFIANSIHDIRQLYKDGLLKFGIDNPELIEEHLLNIGDQAKVIITENLALVTKDPFQKAQEREFGDIYPAQAGRLGGRSASEEFERIVKVVRI